MSALRDVLAAHHAMVAGARQADAQVDLEAACEVYAGISRLLGHWDELTAGEQRAVVRTIEHLVNPGDEEPDLRGPDGFRDDLRDLRRLEAELGYVWPTASERGVT